MLAHPELMFNLKDKELKEICLTFSTETEFNIFLWMGLLAHCRTLELQRTLHDAAHAVFYMNGHSVLHLHSSTVIHSHMHAIYIHTHVECTNVICRLCTQHLYLEGCFLQACRASYTMHAKEKKNTHIITQTKTNRPAYIYTHRCLCIFVWKTA